MIREIIFGPAAGTTKISHSWWKRLDDCRRRVANGHSVEAHRQHLFTVGMPEFVREAETYLKQTTNFFDGRTKTIPISINSDETIRLRQLANMHGVSLQDVIGQCIRVGYSLSCEGELHDQKQRAA